MLYIKGCINTCSVYRIPSKDALKYLQVLKRRVFFEYCGGFFGSHSSSRKVAHEWLDTKGTIKQTTETIPPGLKTMAAAKTIKQKQLTRAATLV